MIPEYLIETYNIDVVNSEFVRTSQVSSYESLQFFDSLNESGGAIFSLNMNNPAADPNIFIPYRTNILIKRNGVGVWVGPFTGYDYNYENGDGKINFRCLGYLEHLKSRYTDQNTVYTATAANTVAWDLIDTVQTRTNGELMIRQGSIETIDDIDDTLEYSSIANALINQSDNIIGYDLDLTPQTDSNGLLEQVNFNLYKSKGTFRNDLKKVELEDLQQVQSSVNNNLFNTITALAQGTGEDVLSATASNPSLQQGYTRREAIIKRSEEKSQDNLQSFADKYFNRQSVPSQNINLTFNPASNFNFTNINIGDTLSISVTKPDTFLNVVGQARIIERNVQLDSEGVEYITPKFKFT